MTRPVAGLLSAAFAWALAGQASAGAADAEPVVIGLSVPNGPGSYRATVALAEGARACVGRVNAAGGVRGRPVKLVVLDGGNDPARHAENVRTLVREQHAVAIVGCGGDAVCGATAAAAAEMHVPLVGALSGLKAMGHDRSAWSFPLRPDYAHEALALARQIRSLGITRAALLTDSPVAGEKVQAVQRALQEQGVRQTTLAVALGDHASVTRALAAIAAGDFQTVLMDVAPDMVDVLAERRVGDAPSWPRMLTSLASSSFQGVGNIFPGKVLGFTQLVPSPETDNLPLTFDLLHDADQYASGKAIDFDGMASYMAARLAIEGIRRAGPHPDGDSVAAALADAKAIDLGGYVVSFAGGRATGSDRVTIGLRSRDGFFLK